MAVNNKRSMNADLKFGIRDGLYKSATPDRGGDVETDAVMQRASELQVQYNIAWPGHAPDCPCCGVA